MVGVGGAQAARHAAAQRVHLRRQTPRRRGGEPAKRCAAGCALGARCWKRAAAAAAAAATAPGWACPPAAWRPRGAGAAPCRSSPPPAAPPRRSGTAPRAAGPVRGGDTARADARRAKRLGQHQAPGSWPLAWLARYTSSLQTIAGRGGTHPHPERLARLGAGLRVGRLGRRAALRCGRGGPVQAGQPRKQCASCTQPPWQQSPSFIAWQVAWSASRCDAEAAAKRQPRPNETTAAKPACLLCISCSPCCVNSAVVSIAPSNAPSATGQSPCVTPGFLLLPLLEVMAPPGLSGPDEAVTV